MRFRFPLEGLLRIRKEEERQAVYELQRLRHEEARLQQRIEHIRTQREIWTRAYSQLGRVEHVPEDTLLVEQYLAALDAQRNHLSRLLGTLRRDIAQAMELVSQRMRARKQLEHLREKQYREFCATMQRMERCAIDDLNTLRFAHRLLEGGQ